MWEVVGGGDKGGILVRAGQGTSSEQLPERLSTGAIVEELELAGERLHYKLVTGQGPASGWVSVTLKDKALLIRKDSPATEPEAVPLGRDEELRDGDYFVTLGPIFKKAGTDPETQKIVQLNRKVGAIVHTTGKIWKGPTGGFWVELDVSQGDSGAGEKPGYVMIDAAGFGTPGPCLQKASPEAGDGRWRSDYNPGQGLDSASLLKSARRKRRTGAVREQARVWEPHVEMKIVDVARRMQCVESWANSLSHGCCNAKQAELCAKVAGQVTQEMGVEGPDVGEPLRWAVHGGPGTGKSYVLNLIRQQLFEDILQWKQGDQFQVVTLQAVMANDLNGDTIHHAFGLNWQGTGDERISGHRLLDLSVQALRLRWLIIDEISMVSAELLARLELRCRELVRDLAPGKYAKERANARPFGGLNVILAGDLWQLPPPRGTFLGEVPWEWLTQGKAAVQACGMRPKSLVMVVQTALLQDFLVYSKTTGAEMRIVLAMLFQLKAKQALTDLGAAIRMTNLQVSTWDS
ncbi:unnamed protein product [Durusdinium trenchii]|uniref:ATP-dependent DNA helicase n=1 Tax=Durusdinium trenchii TaxID=1381693 RepID=A0ABP0SRU0_9DINO